MQPQQDFSDMHMSDNDDELSIPSPPGGPRSHVEAEQQSDDEDMMALSDIGPLLRTAPTKTANGGMNGEATWTDSDRIRSLLDSDTESQDGDAAGANSVFPLKNVRRSTKDLGVTIKQESPELEELMSCFAPAEVIDLAGADSGVAIKEESPEFEELMSRFLPAEVIELSDTEDVAVKQEFGDDRFDWTSMADETISISDTDDEDQAILDDETTIPASLPSVRERFGKPNIDDDDVIDVGSAKKHGSAPTPGLRSSFLGKKGSKAKNCAAYIAAHSQRQREFRERMLAMSGRSAPAVISKKMSGAPPSGLEIDDPNDDSWMNSDVNFDEEAAKKFQELKRSYKVKQKADTNTLEDDFEFQRASRTEKARLKRLELDYMTSRGPVSEEDESDEDGLFVSQSSARREKRRATTDHNQEGNGQGQKKRKQNHPRKQTMDDIEKDLEWNLMAGIEGYLHNERSEADGEKEKKKGKKRGKAVDKPEAVNNNTNGKKSWKKKDKALPKKRPTQAGYLSNAGSLLNSNIFEDAAANRDLAPLPITTEKNKAKALAAMVANVPIGDRRRSEKEHIRRATVTLGRQKVNPDGEGAWKFTGMDSSLRHHQVQGAAWMKERELGDSEPLGGILADGMGLGKTVMALGLAVANPPTRIEKYKATLIVCTPALLNQWEKEIRKHVTKGVFRRVMRHHAGNRQTGLGAIGDMQNADIVLTTYHEVMRSYPKTDVPEDIDNFEKLRAWWKQIWEEDRGILHKARFFRIILDESQAIKNHLSQTSIACRALMGKHRWALSGTPIMNRTEELYPYFKFLRVECTGSYDEFTQNFCVEGSTNCNKRLHCILDQILIRRTMSDKVLGHPIVSLPDTHQATERLGFNLVERLIYKIISRRFIRAINKASAKGQLEKKPGYGIVMFLRLRQMVAHTFLIQEILQEMFELDSVDRLEAASIAEDTEANKAARSIIAALRRMVAAKREPVEATPDRQSSDPEIGAPGELAVKLGQRLRALKENSNLEELRNEQLCHKCKNVPEDPWVTSCLHVYCKECLEFLAYAASKKDQDSTLCIECETRFTSSESCAGLKELAMDDPSELPAEPRSRKPRAGKVNMRWVAYDDELVMSAKTIGVENQIKKWLEEEPNKKIIVFSQFLMIMAILERVCLKNGWDYCNYNGKMSHQARDKAIAAFGKENSKIKIMIASLKCGGIGLNLTMASRVTCVDLWFNSCMEQQAFCRVFRIGQTDETFITRFIIKDTVDDKLEIMQKRKEKIIGAALDDRSITSKLSVQEVMRLFGEVYLDKKTKKPFIVMDEDEKLDAIIPPLADDVDDPIAWRK